MVPSSGNVSRNVQDAPATSRNVLRRTSAALAGGAGRAEIPLLIGFRHGQYWD